MAGLKRSKKRTLYRWIALIPVMVLAWGPFAGISRAGKAILKVITDPEGAQVTVDTGEKGVTPCTLEVPEGKRSVQIKLPGHIPVNRQVEVSSKEPTEIQLRLMPINTRNYTLSCWLQPHHNIPLCLPLSSCNMTFVTIFTDMTGVILFPKRYGDN